MARSRNMFFKIDLDSSIQYDDEVLRYDNGLYRTEYNRESD